MIDNTTLVPYKCATDLAYVNISASGGTGVFNYSAVVRSHFVSTYLYCSTSYTIFSRVAVLRYSDLIVQFYSPKLVKHIPSKYKIQMDALLVEPQLFQPQILLLVQSFLSPSLAPFSVNIFILDLYFESTDVNPPTCFGGVINHDFSVGGGTPPYNYSAVVRSSFSFLFLSSLSLLRSFLINIKAYGSPSFQTSSIIPLTGGFNYTVLVQDANGCQIVDSIQVPNPPGFHSPFAFLSYSCFLNFKQRLCCT